MNDVSIFVWNLIIGFFDFVFGIILAVYCDCSYNKFYERVRHCIYIFICTSILFVVTIKRAFSYTSYIFHGIDGENRSGWKIVNFCFSWIPFLVTIAIFIWSLYYFVDLFSYDSYCHSDRKVFCSVKTIKLITTFSTIEYNNCGFYYRSKNGEDILLCFSPVVYIVLCFCAHNSDKRLNKIVQREENREKEKKLYGALISDLEEIKKENETKSSEYFDSAKKNLEKLSR